MNGVNLVPAERRLARVRAGRIRVWMMITPLCASLLAGAYGCIRAAWSSDVEAIAADITKTDADIVVAEKDDSAAKSLIAELQPKFRAARAVGDQPDWGVLLSLIAGRLGHDAILSGCTLAPVLDTPSAATVAKAAKGDGPKSRDSGRPDRFSLELSGVARTQAAVSAFVSGLERAGIFDRVAIAESRRSSIDSQEGFTFKIDCILSDPLAEVP